MYHITGIGKTIDEQGREIACYVSWITETGIAGAANAPDDSPALPVEDMTQEIAEQWILNAVGQEGAEVIEEYVPPAPEEIEPPVEVIPPPWEEAPDEI